MMKWIQSVVGSAALLLLFVSPAAAGELDDLIAKSIQTYQRIETVRKDMNEAVGDLGPQKRAIDQALFTLEKAPLDQAELDELDQQMAREQQRLEQMQQSGVGEASLRYRRQRLYELQLKREAGAIRDDAAQASHREKLQAERDQLDAQIRQIQQPFSEKIEAIQASVSDQDSVLTKSLRPYFKTPGGAYAGGRVENFHATVHNAFASLEWSGPDEERLAWAHIRIRPLSEIQEHDRHRLLSDKYPIRTASDSSVWVWAGHYLITFVPVHEDLKHEAALLEAIHGFVDLEGLAQITAPAADQEVAEVSTP